MVHGSFILGQGWLLSNHFCKACQNCFHPSFCHYSIQSSTDGCINCCFVVIAPANAIMQHKHRQLGQNQFWHVLQNWLLCSHPWPNMNEHCTKLKKTNLLCYHALKSVCCYLFLILRNLESNPGFLFTQLNQATYSKFGKSNFDMIYKMIAEQSSVIQYAWPISVIWQRNNSTTIPWY